VFNRQPLDFTLSHMHSVYTLTFYFVRSLLSLSSHLRIGIPNGLFSSGFSDFRLIPISSLSPACFSPRPSNFTSVIILRGAEFVNFKWNYNTFLNLIYFWNHIRNRNFLKQIRTCQTFILLPERLRWRFMLVHELCCVWTKTTITPWTKCSKTAHHNYRIIYESGSSHLSTGRAPLCLELNDLPEAAQAAALNYLCNKFSGGSVQLQTFEKDDPRRACVQSTPGYFNRRSAGMWMHL
jgi:hypothetical protein